MIVNGKLKFNKNGNLPVGIHAVTMQTIEKYFAWTPSREDLTNGLAEAIQNLKEAGVRKVWIDGSFVTKKDGPNDIDGCWEANKQIDLSKWEKVLIDTDPPRKAMKKKYGVDFLISNISLIDAKGRLSSPLSFFQRDRDYNKKGILLIKL